MHICTVVSYAIHTYCIIHIYINCIIFLVFVYIIEVTSYHYDTLGLFLVSFFNSLYCSWVVFTFDLILLTDMHLYLIMDVSLCCSHY